MAQTVHRRRVLYAGAARVIITPPVGIRMMGYTVQEHCSESVERDLTATALVLTDGRQKVVIIACDLLFIQSPHVDRIREHIARRLEIPPAAVLLNFSHTHLGPTLPGWQPADTPEQEQMQRRYLGTLEDALAGVASMAENRLTPCRVAAGKGSAPMGINRRERLPDGRVVIGQNPDGPVDNEVGVIRIDDAHGQSIALIMTAAAHTVVLGPKTAQLSPDYVGPAREIVEKATNGLSLFLLGAAGNVNPACGIGTGGQDQYDDLDRMGAMLAGEVLTTWARIRTHNRQGPRRIVQSVAAISAWDYEQQPVDSLAHFVGATRRLSLNMAPLPDRETAVMNLVEYRRQFEQAEKSGDIGKTFVAQRLVHWSELVLRTIIAGETPVRRHLDFWALRINDIGIVAVNGEPFAELGLAVKERSPLPHTFFLGYSNGCLGYLPTPEAFDEGGMEVHESFQNYLLPCGFTREWGPTIINTSLEMLTALSKSES
jgi:neutral ceramidase